MTAPVVITHNREQQREHRATGHPERPQRVEAILDHISTDPVLGRLPVLPWAPPSHELPLLVHSSEHVQRVEAWVAAGGGWFDADTYATPASLEAALAAVAASVRGLEAVLSSESRSAFAVTRPPGHHATRDRPMGFCIFNTVAIVAAEALRRGRNRVAVVDIDVHHGNGTQDIYYDDPRLLYCSLHQFPFYPGSGAAGERGGPHAAGATVNVPVPARTGDAEWLRLFDAVVAPAVDSFAPELVLVSAGFDAHADDPLAELELHDATYGEVARRISELTARHCDGQSVWLLEGGYDLDALSRSVAECLRVLAR